MDTQESELPPSYNEVIAESWKKQEEIDKFFNDYVCYKNTYDGIFTSAFAKMVKGEDRNVENQRKYRWSVNTVLNLLNDKYTYYVFPIIKGDSVNFHSVIGELAEGIYPYLVKYNNWKKVAHLIDDESANEIMPDWKELFTSLLMDGKEYPHIRVAEFDNESKKELGRIMINEISK